MSFFNKCERIPLKDIFEELPKDVFENGYTTSYQHDFKRYCHVVRKGYRYIQDETEPRPKVVSRPYEREDHETYAKYSKGAVVPIELHMAPKPILRTNPHVPFEELGELPTASKEEAIKTRPRLYMTPAVPIDDVKEPDRQRLCSYMYTTQGRKVEKEATAYFKRIIPRIDTIETTDKVSLKVDNMPPLKENFVKRGRGWDHQQIRGEADPTREFWLNRDAAKAKEDPIEVIVPEDVKKVIRELVKQERLSSAHDKKACFTYTGYKPRFPLGVALEKKQLPTLHPLLSVSQSITNRTPEEINELIKIRDLNPSHVSD